MASPLLVMALRSSTVPSTWAIASIAAVELCTHGSGWGDRIFDLLDDEVEMDEREK